jgi:hypothetical protein
VLDKTTSESRGCRTCSLQAPTANRRSCPAIPVWYIRRVVFWFGVHNWTELRREKLHSAGMDHDPTQETIVEICGLMDSNAGFVNGPR